MGAISARTMVAPFTNKVHLVTMLIILMCFLAFRLSGGGLFSSFDGGVVLQGQPSAIDPRIVTKAKPYNFGGTSTLPDVSKLKGFSLGAGASSGGSAQNGVAQQVKPAVPSSVVESPGAANAAAQKSGAKTSLSSIEEELGL